jgi:hypothetical protein
LGPYANRRSQLERRPPRWLLLNNIRGLKTCSFTVENGMKMEPELRDERHLSPEQRDDIAIGLQDSTTGPVSLTAAASDKEAVCYQGEIASVLEDMGCDVEIDNPKGRARAEAIPAGVEMTIKEETVRPAHASRIVRAFRRAGVVIATKINARRRKNDTLYITVGPNDSPALLPTTRPPIARRLWKSLAALFAKSK